MIVIDELDGTKLCTELVPKVSSAKGEGIGHMLADELFRASVLCMVVQHS